MSHAPKAGVERLLREKLAAEIAIEAQIAQAAGSSTIRRAPITGPNWPQRSDYPNRAAFRRACAEWRKP
jgi:hypothetical protein